MNTRKHRALGAVVKSWRASDQHSGIGNLGGVLFTYKHISRRLPATNAIYRVETWVPLSPPQPLHRNVYYVPGAQLDEFVFRQHECAEIIIDIRRMTHAAAVAELASFRRRAARRRPQGPVFCSVSCAQSASRHRRAGRGR